MISLTCLVLQPQAIVKEYGVNHLGFFFMTEHTMGLPLGQIIGTRSVCLISQLIHHEWKDLWICSWVWGLITAKEILWQLLKVYVQCHVPLPTKNQ